MGIPAKCESLIGTKLLVSSAVVHMDESTRLSATMVSLGNSPSKSEAG